MHLYFEIMSSQDNIGVFVLFYIIVHLSFDYSLTFETLKT